MDKKDEKRVREIAREEAMKCIREENARLVSFKGLFARRGIKSKNTQK